jgi:hypothetical protein
VISVVAVVVVVVAAVGIVAAVGAVAPGRLMCAVTLAPISLSRSTLSHKL